MTELTIFMSSFTGCAFAFFVMQGMIVLFQKWG